MSSHAYAHLRRYAQRKKGAEIANVEVAGDGAVIYNGHRFEDLWLDN